jgi:hypothetical protein
MATSYDLKSRKLFFILNLFSSQSNNAVFFNADRLLFSNPLCILIIPINW